MEWMLFDPSTIGLAIGGTELALKGAIHLLDVFITFSGEQLGIASDLISSQIEEYGIEVKYDSYD